MDQQEQERMSQQCVDLMKWFDRHDTINHRQAEDFLGIMRLAARIFDLRSKYNYKFTTEWVTFQARNGKIGKFKNYRRVMANEQS